MYFVTFKRATEMKNIYFLQKCHELSHFNGQYFIVLRNQPEEYGIKRLKAIIIVLKLTMKPLEIAVATKLQF